MTSTAPSASDAASNDRPIALLLPGQGAQHPGMAVELYGADAYFTAAMDGFFELMGEEGNRLRADWLAEHPSVPLDDASRAQPLLFAVDYALGHSLIEHGLRPTALLGHSVGELAAAALADVFDMPGAANIMLARSTAMATAPAGGLLAVAATPDDLTLHLDAAMLAAGVGVGAVNAPRQTILGGPEAELAAIEKMLRDRGIGYRRVGSRQPFHCSAVSPAAELFESGFTGVSLRVPHTRIWSSRTAKPVEPEQARTAGFWARQLAEPVLFWPALDSLLNSGDFTLVEAGPGKGLSMLAKRHPSVRTQRSEVVPLLPSSAHGTLAHWESALDQLRASR